MTDLHCRIQFDHSFNEEVRAIVNDEVGTIEESIKQRVLDELSSSAEGEVQDKDMFEQLNDRLDTLEGLNTDETDISDLENRINEVEDHNSEGYSVDQLADNIVRNHEEAINTLNSHGEDMQSMQCELNSLRGKVGELAENQETAEEQIAMLNRRVDTLVKCIASFRTGLLMTTGHPNFLVDLDADTTPPLNARHVHEDAAADELINMIDDVTESLKPDLDGGAQTN